MTTGVPLIDLDEMQPGPDEPRGRRPVPRALPAVVVVLAVLATLGFSTGPLRGLELVLVAGGSPAAAFTLGTGALYTASFGVANPNSESGLRRYDLDTGAVRWATALPQGVQNLQIDDTTGVLMARSGTDPRITFLDAGTGRPLWSLEAANTSVVTLSRRGALIFTDIPGNTVLRLVDARTGGTVWRRTVDARVYLGPDDLWSTPDPRRVVTISRTGIVYTIDFRTGALLSRGDLGAPMTPDLGAEGNGALPSTIGDDRLVIRRPVDGTLTLAAYRLVPFERLWQRADGASGLANPCGALWCIRRSGVPGDPGVDAIDPADGEIRWTAPAIGFAWPFGPGRLLAGDTSDDPVITLLDEATGRPVRVLGTVQLIGGVLMHRDRALPATEVMTADRDGTLHTIGTTDVVAAFGCDAQGAYLACPSSDGPTKVWRIP